jgi:hypothetical protein
VLVALLVGAAAPIAGRLVDRHGDQLPALIGFGAPALGLALLGITGMTLDGAITIPPLIPVGLRSNDCDRRSGRGHPAWPLAGVRQPIARSARSHSPGRGRPAQTTTRRSGRPVTNTSRTSGKANNSPRI